MQAKQVGDKNVRGVGVEEELIKFQSSPNFKNMKKFLKNRSDLETSTTTTLASPISVAASSEPVEKLERKEVKPLVVPPHAIAAAQKPVAVQPPLPPYPPPDSPPLNVTIKQERQDDDDEDNQNNESVEGEPTQDTQSTTVAEKNPVEPSQTRPKKTICKEFIRGNCKRPVCKYAHEVDVSQLAGVFTFCWNYQNDVCTFPNCRFVHASVFEEAEFYRTGILPPHARSHLKKQLPPPPPDETQPEINFTNPPPPPHIASVEQRPEVEDFRTALPCATSPLKREWAQIEEFSTSPRELESNEHMAKKCKNCDIMELSVRRNKEMTESMIQSSEEINKKIALLNKKSNKLFNVLLALIKPATLNKSPVANSLINGGEKEKSMLEQLNSFMGSSNSRLSSLINDDSLKFLLQNIIGGGNTNLPSLMAKLLCSAGEPTLPTEASRDT